MIILNISICYEIEDSMKYLLLGDKSMVYFYNLKKHKSVKKIKKQNASPPLFLISEQKRFVLFMLLGYREQKIN